MSGAKLIVAKTLIYREGNFTNDIKKNKGKEGLRTMKNISKTVRAAILLLVLCMISTAMLGGTFAKYTSEYAGQDTALVARWSFEAKGGEITMGAENTELNLFDHLYSTYINKTYGTDDDSEHAQYIIAPGVGDEFTVKMDYIADVAADVVIEITELDGNAAVPMEYSVDDGTTWVTLANLPDALADQIRANTNYDFVGDDDTDDGSFRITKVATDIVTPHAISETVEWKWRYAKGEAGSAYATQTDEQDTALGIASQAAAQESAASRTTYGIKIDITATQVTPEQAGKTAITAIVAITTNVGDTLTAGGLTPVDATVTYQWQRCASVGGVYEDIIGETNASYELIGNDTGKFIKVVATGTGGYTGYVISAAIASP